MSFATVTTTTTTTATTIKCSNLQNQAHVWELWWRTYHPASPQVWAESDEWL